MPLTLSNIQKTMKQSYPITKYDGVIKFLAEQMTMFSTDHLRLLVDAKQIDKVPDSRDWARVLRSAQSRGLCKKTDVYQRSNLRGSNNIPRAMWTHPKLEVKI